MKRFALTLACAAAALGWANSASARKPYFDEFNKLYVEGGSEDFKKAAGEAKCNICHEGTDKKMRNAYGMALGKIIGKNEKDAAKIQEALKMAEAKKPADDGPTFGELIKMGKLPGAK